MLTGVPASPRPPATCRAPPRSPAAMPSNPFLSPPPLALVTAPRLPTGLPLTAPAPPPTATATTPATPTPSPPRPLLPKAALPNLPLPLLNTTLLPRTTATTLNPPRFPLLAERLRLPLAPATPPPAPLPLPVPTLCKLAAALKMLPPPPSPPLKRKARRVVSSVRPSGLCEDRATPHTPLFPLRPSPSPSLFQAPIFYSLSFIWPFRCYKPFLTWMFLLCVCVFDLSPIFVNPFSLWLNSCSWHLWAPYRRKEEERQGGRSVLRQHHDFYPIQHQA